MIDYPTVKLAHLPTPLQPLPALTKYLDGPNIFVKRDDCTGLAGGGNKTRKLEYIMADALAKGADTIVTVGATQSNHVRQTVAAAAKLGLKAEVLLQKSVVRDADYARNGNYMLDALMGAVIHEIEPVKDINQAGLDFCEQLNQQGRRAYYVGLGGSSVLGSLGYVQCAQELLSQTQAEGIALDHIVTASGSYGTQAGLLVGLAQERAAITLHGISVNKPAVDLRAGVLQLAQQTADYIGLSSATLPDAVICNDQYYAPGYGLPNDKMIEAVTLCARIEGLLLDPVYTGKAMAALIDMVRQGHFTKGENILFIHTGGAAALHSYRTVFEG